MAEEDERYKEVARLTYDNFLEMRKLSYTLQADYGKWAHFFNF